MSDKADELPEAVFGLGGESDVVAERSGATTAKARRPVPVDPPEAMDEAEDDDTDDTEGDEDDDEDDVTRPDAGPTG
ncbi:hypothetical protein [Nonomuraea sp. SBT364]|uniref:hypothetical protein n=1 Tax=Nonomuraea sp. SBT364 TaxID=1580530 RepID=UPI00066BD4B3|nr:hypothetical protein [Nonomuraea sp. SBT364]